MKSSNSKSGLTVTQERGWTLNDLMSENTCYFERAKMKKEAMREAKEKSKPSKDKSKSKQKQEIE